MEIKKFETLSIPKSEIRKINDKLEEMIIDGEWIPKMAISKLCLILHFFKKSETEKLEQAIHRKAKSIIYDDSERAYLIKILVSLGLLQKVRNYRVGYNADLYIYTGEYGYCTPKGEFLEDLEYLTSREQRKKEKRDSKFNFLKGLQVNAEDLITFDLNEALDSGDSEKLEAVQRQIQIASEINSGIYRVNKKDSGECRLYSNITFLKSEYRQTCTFNGKRVVEVDVRSCHPSILPRVLEDFAQKREYDYLDMKAKGKNLFNMKVWDIEKLRMETVGYIEYVESGIYEAISYYTILPKEEAKRQLLMFLNDTRASANYPNIHEWFQTRFPIMTEIIDYLHYVEHIGKKKKSGKNVRTANSFRHSLSFMCMQTEAKLILENVVLSFRKRNPESLIASVHDALIIEEGREAEIESLIIERFREIGINVQTKKIQYEEGRESEDSIDSKDSITEAQLSPESPTSYYVTEKGKSSRTNSEVPAQSSRTSWQVDRPSQIRTLKDGRLTCSVKNRTVNSRKGESLEAFQERISRGYDFSPSFPASL